jgi:hypothetical protein
MEVTDTTFGTVSRTVDRTTVAATQETLADWVRRGDMRRPLPEIGVPLPLTGAVVTLNGDGATVNIYPAGIPYRVLRPWVRETLHRAGYPNHPG